MPMPSRRQADRDTTVAAGRPGGRSSVSRGGLLAGHGPDRGLIPVVLCGGRFRGGGTDDRVDDFSNTSGSVTLRRTRRPSPLASRSWVTGSSRATRPSSSGALTLAMAPAVSLGASSTATVTIVDDDKPGDAVFLVADLHGGRNGGLRRHHHHEGRRDDPGGRSSITLPRPGRPTRRTTRPPLRPWSSWPARPPRPSPSPS